MCLNIWPRWPATRRTQEEELHSVHTAVRVSGRGATTRRDGAERSGADHRRGSHSEWAPLQRQGRLSNPSLARWDKIQKQKIDHHLSKRIPLRARSPLESFSLSPLLTGLAQRYALRWLSVLTVIMWILDSRSEREQTVHQIGKKQQPPLRVCSRDLTIPRRDAPAVSWISTRYERPVPKMPTGAYPFSKHTFESVRRENLSLTRRFRSSQNCHLTLSSFEEFDTFTLCPKAITVCGKLARAVPRSFSLFTKRRNPS